MPLLTEIALGTNFICSLLHKLYPHDNDEESLYYKYYNCPDFMATLEYKNYSAPPKESRGLGYQVLCNIGEWPQPCGLLVNEPIELLSLQSLSYKISFMPFKLTSSICRSEAICEESQSESVRGVPRGYTFFSTLPCPETRTTPITISHITCQWYREQARRPHRQASFHQHNCHSLVSRPEIRRSGEYTGGVYTRAGCPCRQRNGEIENHWP